MKFIFCRFFLFLSVVIIGVLPAFAEDDVNVAIIGKVTGIEMAGMRELTAIQLEPEAHYIVSINVTDVNVPNGVFAKGKPVNLAIHSPSNLFETGSSERAVGKLYLFKMLWNSKEQRFQNVTAEESKTDNLAGITK